MEGYYKPPSAYFGGGPGSRSRVRLVTTDGKTSAAPLAGIRVLDAGFMLAGPLVGRQLADLGAEVVKLEPPGGDPSRGPDATEPDWQPNDFWKALHGGTRSVVVDLKRPEGLEAALELLPRFDIFVENLRPGVMTRLGLGWERARESNPDLIYCSIRGFAGDGELSGLTATDGVIQAYSGWAPAEPEDDLDPGINPTLTVADFITGSFATQGVLAALVRRENGGGGSQVELNMAEVMTYARALCHAPGLESPSTFVAITADDQRVLIQTALHLAVRMLRVLADEPGFGGLADDPRFQTKEGRSADAEEYLTTVRSAIRRRPLADWLRLFGAAGVPIAAIGSPRPPDRNPFRFDGDRRPLDPRTVVLGADTEAVLSEAGLDRGRIDSIEQARREGTPR
jgi:crotonobetainyl-CoA:carnitine CoA-transferase CaiB-like acyl-CoA transferase